MNTRRVAPTYKPAKKLELCAQRLQLLGRGHAMRESSPSELRMLTFVALFQTVTAMTCRIRSSDSLSARVTWDHNNRRAVRDINLPWLFVC